MYTRFVLMQTITIAALKQNIVNKYVYIYIYTYITYIGKSKKIIITCTRLHTYCRISWTYILYNYVYYNKMIQLHVAYGINDVTIYI